MKKYKLKLDYTADELKELKELGKYSLSPMYTIYGIVKREVFDEPLVKLWEKYHEIECADELDFMTDINNAVMGTAIFPEEKYVVHDKATDQYIYYSMKRIGLFWGQPHSDIAETHTKEEWLAFNPAYEPMLEKVEDNEKI